MYGVEGEDLLQDRDILRQKSCETESPAIKEYFVDEFNC